MSNPKIADECVYQESLSEITSCESCREDSKQFTSLLSKQNGCVSIKFSTSNIIHRTTKSSKTFAKHEVKEIGLVSSSHIGCDTFGIGVMYESFQALGKVPEFKGLLKMIETGPANS